jgi:putative acetyltransferase
MEVLLEEVKPQSEEAINLTAKLFNELEEIYGKGKIEDFIDENKDFLKFYVAKTKKGAIAACGGLKKFDAGSAEIKRMYVEKEFRGEGISKVILDKMEEVAANLNYKRVVLKTGIRQPEAVNLYKRAGYVKIQCFGEHIKDEESICFEKNLS